MSLAVLVLVAAFVVLAILRLPLSISMIVSGVLYLFISGKDVGLVADQIMNSLYSNFILVAIPMFIFAANVMNAGTVSDRLWSFSNALVGRMRGGLAHVSVFIALLFASMTGSAVADAAGPGLLTFRAMTRIGGYPRSFAAAVTAAAATISPVVPPSIPMILYAVIANVSVGSMFLAGIVPGLMMAAALMLAVAFVARRRGLPVGEKTSLREILHLLRRAVLPMLMPVIVLAGIYSGAFTPTEAAVVAGLYALFLSMIVYRAFGPKQLAAIILESSRATASIGLLIGAAFLFSYIITSEQAGVAFVQLVESFDLSRIELLLVLNLGLLLAGCFLDTGTLLLVIVPILLPVARAHGIDPIHFGVVVIVNIMIGMITPPYGLLLYVLGGLTKAPLGEMFREIWLFVGVLIVVLLLLVFIPGLSLFLPNFFEG